jgi:hypothetical protein
MKNKSLMFLLLLGILLPMAVYADGDSQDDSRYLAGAVPEVKGKVVFSKEFIISGMSKDEIYSRTIKYLNERMASNKNENSRVAYSNKDDGTIAAVAKEWLTFSSTFISLDRSEISYQLTANCFEGKCIVSIARISYAYQQKEKYTAEEWITDKVALSKDKKKLVRGTAKWRRATIDMVDKYYKDFLELFSLQEEKPVVKIAPKAVVTTNNAPVVVTPTVAPKKAVQAQTIDTKTPVAVVRPQVAPVAKAQTAVQNQTVAAPALRSVSLESIPSEVLSSVYRCKTVVAIGNDVYNMTTITANKGLALGFVSDTPMAFVFFDANQNVSAMNSASSFTVKCIDPSSKQVVMVIDCASASSPASNGKNVFAGKIQSLQVAEK